MCGGKLQSEKEPGRNQEEEKEEEVTDGNGLKESETNRTLPVYRGTSLARKRTPLGTYRRPVPRVLGGWLFAYERGTPVSNVR